MMLVGSTIAIATLQCSTIYTIFVQGDHVGIMSAFKVAMFLLTTVFLGLVDVMA